MPIATQSMESVERYELTKMDQRSVPGREQGRFFASSAASATHQFKNLFF